MSKAQVVAPATAKVAQAVDQLIAVLGKERVDTSADAIAAHQDEFALLDPSEGGASAVLYPDTTEHVQAIVRVAGEHKIPLWTFSTGKNLAFGGSSQKVPGSMVVNLSRMNRVLEVNEHLAYAEIEPGVSFFDLADHLEKGDYDLWTQIPGLGWGSLTGNGLERGMGRTRYGDHFSQICGMEVVLGTGEVVRTGMGGLENQTMWHLYKGGYGPGLEGLFAQSNYGIVTKIGLWLIPRPEAFYSCAVQFAREEDLVSMIDIIGDLLLDGTIDGQPSAGNAVRVARVNSHRSEWTDGQNWLPRARIPDVMERFGVGWWNVSFGLYGREEMVDLRWKIVQEALKDVPGVRVKGTKYPGDVRKEDMHPADLNIASKPNTAPWETVNWAGAPGRGAIVDFAPVVPRDGATALAHSLKVEATMAAAGFDFGSAWFWGPRHLLHPVAIAYDRDDRDEAARADRLCRQLISDSVKDGYGPYRGHVAMMDFIADQFSWNDHALRKVQQTLKGALDPAGILSPGKQGIWPPG